MGVRVCTLVFFLTCVCVREVEGSGVERPLALVLPEETHTKLQIQNETLNFLRTLDSHVSVVSVIGPYRSGKSFLLNQLLGQRCDEGFDVGHQRHTQTKGVWLWPHPTPITIEGKTVSLLYLDTEGFEGVGQADVYDDRIFALSAMLSSVLIYNLPEAIREQDLQKLSFAVQLSSEFFDRVSSQAAEPSSDGGSTPKTQLILPSLLWLIQRDFLEGSSVQDMLASVLRPVHNPHNDKNVAQVNEIRQSLTNFPQSKAFSLVQPHTQRTKLCDMTDKELDPVYVKQRNTLKETVQKMLTPKKLSSDSQPLTGVEFADFVRDTVEALNNGDIPNAGSIVQVFNKALKERCLTEFTTALERFTLPADLEDLEAAYNRFYSTAKQQFTQGRFGRSDDLDEEPFLKVLRMQKTQNQYESQLVCEQQATLCEEQVDVAALSSLPSLRRFRGLFDGCSSVFSEVCRGPSQPTYSKKLEKMWSREWTRFQSEYNDRLSRALVLMGFAGVLVFRFVSKKPLLELLCWVLCASLELLPRVANLSSGGTHIVYDSAAWQALVTVYEAIVYNDVYDLNAVMASQWAWAGLAAAVMAFLGLQLTRRRRQRARVSRDPPFPSPFAFPPPNFPSSVHPIITNTAPITILLLVTPRLLLGHLS